MKLFRTILTACLFTFSVSSSLAGDDLAPLSISFFGLYGTPVQPLSLSRSNNDGLGFDFLAEYQPSHYASVGLGYETTTFYGSQAFTAGSFNLEGRLFPFAGLRQPYNPYLTAEAGLNLASGSPSQWGGAYALKVGLGTKVQFVGPLSLDFAVESHWMGNSPNYLQYVDGRFGIDYAIQFGNSSASTSNPPAKATATPIQTPTAMTTPTLTPIPMVPTVSPTFIIKSISPSPTPTEILIENTPTPEPNEGTAAHSKVKKYYLKGIQAFYAHKYSSALADLRTAVTYKEKVPAYYYAECYATMGVIYQFYRPIPHHLKLALGNYKKAYLLDPDTPAVKKYYKKLKAQLAKGGTISKPIPKRKNVEVNADSTPAGKAPEPTAVPAAVSNEKPGATPASNNGSVPIDLGTTK